MRLIGGLSKVTRQSDGVDLSRLKRVYAIRAVRFEGELLMFFSFARRQPEQAIEIGEVRHVALYAGYNSSDFLDRRRQRRITKVRYENVRAFVHKLLCCGKADAATAASNECDFSFELVHVFLSSIEGCPSLTRTCPTYSPRRSSTSERCW